jgi:hypothetical protein
VVDTRRTEGAAPGGVVELNARPEIWNLVVFVSGVVALGLHYSIFTSLGTHKYGEQRETPSIAAP